MIYSYDRTAAVNLEQTLKPLTEGADDPEWLLDRIVDEVQAAVWAAVQAAVWAAVDADRAVKALSKIKVHGQGDFSDGVNPRDPYSLRYSFTIEHPTEVEAEGTYTISLPPLDQLIMGVAKKERETVDRKKVEAAVRKLDIASMIWDAIGDSALPLEGHVLPAEVRGNIETAADSQIHQSIEAWSEAKGTVELPEYPAVYLKWSLSDPKEGVGKPKGSRGVFHVPIKVRWDLRPSHWAFDSERHWYRVN